jgi:ATP-dependent Clp protease protease subunit
LFAAGQLNWCAIFRTIDTADVTVLVQEESSRIEYRVVPAVLWIEELCRHGVEEATVLIDSDGGSAYAMLGIIGAMRYFQERGGVLKTYVTGRAQSAAAIIASSGSKGHRYISRYATLMIHEPWTWVMGDTSKLKNAQQEMERVTELMVDILVENTGLPRKRIQQQLSRKGEWYLSPQDALEHCLMDRVV